METETRSEPDLSLVSLAFLLAIMNGPSELAIVDDANNRAARTQITDRPIQPAIAEQIHQVLLIMMTR